MFVLYGSHDLFSLNAKRPSPDGVMALVERCLVVWLHHPLVAGTQMPTLIRTRLSNRDTTTAGVSDAKRRPVVTVENMCNQETRRTVESQPVNRAAFIASTRRHR